MLLIVAIVAFMARSYITRAISEYFKSVKMPQRASGFNAAVTLAALYVIVQAAWDFVGYYTEFMQPSLLLIQVLLVFFLVKATYEALKELAPKFLAESGLSKASAELLAGLAYVVVYAVGGIYLLDIAGFYVPSLLFDMLGVLVIVAFSAYVLSALKANLPFAYKTLSVPEDLQPHATSLLLLGALLICLMQIGMQVPYFGSITVSLPQMGYQVISFAVSVGVLLTLLGIYRKLK